MNDGNHTGNAQKLPIAERARQGLLLAEPALLLVDVLALEHPTDRAARLALGAALRAAVNFGDLPVSREQRTAQIQRKESTWRPGDWTLGNGDPPTRIWTETQSTVVEYVTREAYRTWRAQCPKRLLSDLSKIHKWLGATPTPVESLPESLPVESLPTKRQRYDALSLAIRAALGAGVVPRPRELFDYLKSSDKTLTITGVSKDGKALLWESSSGSLQKTDISALAKRLKRQ